MENLKTNAVENSCLMMAMIMETPVTLGCLFDEDDLQGTGVELESHITLFYAPEVVIPKDDVLEDIEALMGPKQWEVMMKNLRESEYLPDDWFGTIFELDLFENDSDYLILKLRDCDDPMAKWMMESFKVINKGLGRKWEVESRFPYTPHLTLAELKPGRGRKYMSDSRFPQVLSDTSLSYGDLVLSIGPAGGDLEYGKDRKQYNLTSYTAVQRYFHLEELRKELETLRSAQ